MQHRIEGLGAVVRACVSGGVGGEQHVGFDHHGRAAAPRSRPAPPLTHEVRSGDRRRPVEAACVLDKSEGLGAGAGGVEDAASRGGGEDLLGRPAGLQRVLMVQLSPAAGESTRCHVWLHAS